MRPRRKARVQVYPDRLHHDTLLDHYWFVRDGLPYIFEGERPFFDSWRDAVKVALLNGLLIERSGEVKLLPGAKRWN